MVTWSVSTWMWWTTTRLLTYYLSQLSLQRVQAATRHLDNMMIPEPLSNWIRSNNNNNRKAEQLLVFNSSFSSSSAGRLRNGENLPHARDVFVFISAFSYFILQQTVRKRVSCAFSRGLVGDVWQKFYLPVRFWIFVWNKNPLGFLLTLNCARFNPNLTTKKNTNQSTSPPTEQPVPKSLISLCRFLQLLFTIEVLNFPGFL